MKLFLMIGFLFFSWTGPSAFSSNLVYSHDKEVPSQVDRLLETWKNESKNFHALHEKLMNDYERFGISEKFVKNIFYRSHKMIFTAYEQYSTDKEAISLGKYDCVSGSVILSGILAYFEIPYEVHVTASHVFLAVNINGKNIILEVTDPILGFISEPQEVASYFSKIKETDVEVNNKEAAAFFPEDFYARVNLSNLVGLQYFNQAIKNFNDGNFLVAYQFITTALKYHESERFRDFSDYLKNQIALSAHIEME